MTATAQLSPQGPWARPALPGASGTLDEPLDVRRATGKACSAGLWALPVPARQCPRRPLEGSEGLFLPGPAGACGGGARRGPTLPPRLAALGCGWAPRGTPTVSGRGLWEWRSDEPEEGRLDLMAEGCLCPAPRTPRTPATAAFTPKAAETSKMRAAAGESAPSPVSRQFSLALQEGPGPGVWRGVGGSQQAWGPGPPS